MLIHNGLDTINPTNIEERITELEGIEEHAKGLAEANRFQTKPLGVDTAWESVHGVWIAEDGTPYGDMEAWSEDEYTELRQLRDIRDEVKHCGGWRSSSGLIHSDYLEPYAQEYVRDVDGVDVDKWPFTHINWEAAVDDMLQDYKSVEFGASTYWIRS